ncbi:MAG: hypothetical protein ACXWNJ_15735 [Vulcanimicrobiaceae bacterium]
MKLIAFAAAVEAVTGLVLIINPSLVVWLLWSADLSEAGRALGRVAGFSLLALGLACWPGELVSPMRAATRGLLTYNVLATVLFLYLGVRGELVGPLLWPALVFHAALAILLIRSAR